MELTAILLSMIVMLTLWHSDARSPYSSRQASRKQKKLIEGSMDLKADPCDDFYKYACGNWNQVFVEAGEKYYEPISMLDYIVNQELSNAFNHLSKKSKPRFLKLAYTYYMSCKSVSVYEAINYLIWLKANDNFKWPALWTQPKKHTQFDWVQMLAKMRTYGFNEVFVQQIFMPKVNNVEQFIIDLDKPVADGGFKPLTKENLEILMESLPAQITTDNLENLWLQIHEFEEKLQELDTIEDIEVENETDYETEHLFYVRNLPLDWLKDYIKIILNKTELHNEMQVYIQNIPYMKALDKLVKQHSQRFVCKYLEVRFLWYLFANGPSSFLDIECLANTRSLMPTAMHWEYEQQHPELRQEYSSIYDIFSDIRRHFNNSVIANKHGFNSTVIQYLQNKINHMKLRLNNIPRIDTVDTLEAFYQNLNFDVNSFYENHLRLLRFNFLARRDLLKNVKPVLDFTYLEDSATGGSSSPYFVQSANTVFVPLTLLQHPIYSPGLDDIYKYSSLGFLLAHEIFHGFDNNGLLADASGNMFLLQFEENPLFNASFNCLREINPQIVSEKIADISGLRFAYQAFFDSNTEASTQKTSIYGIEMSLSKLYFLNFAQFYCGDATAEDIILAEHGSDRDRVFDALSHFPEFSKEFKCNSSHLLYHHETCHLWR